MARKLIVEIVGDSSSLEKSFKRSSASANKFGRDVSKFGRGGFAATGAFRSLGRSVAFASSAFLGGVGLGAAIKASFDEMSAFQKVNAQTAAVIKSTGAVAGVTAGHVDELAKSLLNVSGVDDELIKNSENLLLTFRNVRNVVGENNDIFDRATKSALDLSVRFGRDLKGATITLGKALQDPVRGLLALSRTGVQFDTAQRKLIKSLVESGHVLEAQKVILKEVEAQTKGAAAAYGRTLPGQFAKFRETLRNLGGAIAQEFNPALDKLVKQANKWLSNTRNQKRVMDDVRQVVSVVSDVFNTLRGAMEGLNNITGSTKETLKLLLGVFFGFKALKLVSTFAEMATNIGLIGASAGAATGKVTAFEAALGATGASAGRATGKVSGLRTALAGVAALAGLTIAIEVIIHKKEIVDKAKDLGIPFADKSGLDLLRIGAAHLGAEHSGLGIIRRFADDEKKQGKGLGDAIAQAIQGGRDALVKALKGNDLRKGALPPGVIPDTALTKKDLAAIQARLRASREAARQAVVDRAEFAVDRAAATQTLTDDLAALNKLNALLKRRIAGGHDTLELEKQQFAVDQQIADVLKQQREARIKARDARQFKLLGFGPTGEDIVPGVKNLRKQLASVQDAIAGTFLNTDKTKGLLGHIRQVLAGGINSVSADVRSKIQQILADLKGQLKQSSVDVTRFQQSARGQFGLAGAHGGIAGGVVITGPVHIHGVQNVKDIEGQLLKRTKQRAHSRRSTR